MQAAPRQLSRPGPNPFSSDAGATLMEMLIAIVITGILFAALLAGLASMVKTSALHRRQADVGAVVRAGAETLKSTAYTSCIGNAALGTYNTALSTVPHSPDVGVPTVVAITGLDGTTSLVGCATDPGIQMVQIKVTSGDGQTTEPMWVVKSNR